MSLPVNDLRLSMFEPGQVWLMEEPNRIVKIVEPTTIEFIDKSGELPKPEQRPAMTALVTIPTKPIAGFVSEKQAEDNTLIAASLQRPADDGQELPSGMWQEVYTERVVHKIIRSKQRARYGLIVPDEGPLEPQVYCHEERGMTKRQTASSVTNRPIRGKMVPADLVPAGMFKEQKVAGPETAKEGVLAGAISEMPYRELQKLAKARGMNPFGAKKADLIAFLQGKAA